jgi:hypothetical protein
MRYYERGRGSETCYNMDRFDCIIISETLTQKGAYQIAVFMFGNENW